jgi:hypothetical protein
MPVKVYWDDIVKRYPERSVSAVQTKLCFIQKAAKKTVVWHESADENLRRWVARFGNASF